MVMGDLVLTETEVDPVMKKLAESGIEITALHNHLLRAQPATFYMHVLGHGDPVKLATALHDGLALSKTPLGNCRDPAAAARAAAGDRPRYRHDRPHARRQGQGRGRRLPVRHRRGPRPIQDGGMEVPAAMGSAEAINFQPTGDGKAAITGDFVLTADGGEPGAARAARERHRGDGPAQPHAGRSAAAVLHAFLGQ